MIVFIHGETLSALSVPLRKIPRWIVLVSNNISVNKWAQVRHEVPGVVVYLKFDLTFHAWAGLVSEIKYELTASLHKLTFDLTQ